MNTAPLVSSNFSQQLPAAIRQAGRKCEYHFVEFFATQIRNPNTRAAYLQGVRLFLDWCDERGLPLESVDAIAVSAWMENHPGSIATISLHMSALRRLFDFLVVRGVLAQNPALSARAPTERRRTGKTPYLTDEEVRILFDSFATDLISLRDRAIIATMFYTFARVSAVIGLKVGDYKQVGRRTYLHFFEKGSLHHPVPVHHMLEEYLDVYLERAEHGHSRNAPLFRSARNRTGELTDRPVSRENVFELVRRRCRQAGLGAEFGCHSFRASGITNFRKQGGTLEMAKKLAGHASADTTSLYDRSMEDVSQSEIERIRV